MVIVRRAVTDPSTHSTPQGQPNPAASEATDPAAQAEATGAQAEPSAEEALKAEVARLKDQLLRTLADFDNYRKRSRKEISDAEKKAREDQLRELLPVFDNLERASQHAAGSTDVQAMSDGIQLVMKQFVDTLGKLNIERVPSVGQPFDPSMHEAVQQVESKEYPPGAVAQELLAGYRLGDRLIRPAMVVVSKPAAS